MLNKVKLDVRHPISMIHCLASRQKQQTARMRPQRLEKGRNACNKGDRQRLNTLTSLEAGNGQANATRRTTGVHSCMRTASWSFVGDAAVRHRRRTVQALPFVMSLRAVVHAVRPDQTAQVHRRRELSRDVHDRQAVPRSRWASR